MQLHGGAEATPGKSPVADALKVTARKVDQIGSKLAEINRRLEFKLEDAERTPIGTSERRARPGRIALLLFIVAVLIFLARRRLLLRAA